MVYILGINPGLMSTSHDSAACLLKDGKIIAFVEQERFDRIKHSSKFPIDAINYCLCKAGISQEDVDHVSLAWNTRELLESSFSSFGFHIFNFDNMVNRILSYMIARANMKASEVLNRLFLNDITEVNHHLAHAASSYYTSGFKKANILTLDGRGEKESLAVFEGKNGDITRIDQKNFFNNFSLGLCYSLTTKILGLGRFGEGKTMGLAPWGDPKINISNIISYNGSFKDMKADFSKVRFGLSKFSRKKYEKIEEKHKNLAASLQKSLEDSVLNLVDEIYEQNGIPNMCLAGGVALNCKMNGLVLQQENIKDIFIQPAASDSGGALGSALHVYKSLGYKPKFKMEHVYWGPEFTNEEIERELKTSGLSYDYYDDISGIVAELLGKNEIVGWFQGRMEVGPRALGNRSILGNPTTKEMADKVNDVKNREHWRPLCPSILEKSAKEYLEDYYPSPFMILTFQVKKEKIKEAPAIVHVDGSTRPQTVSKKTNPRYHELIRKFEEISSVPIVLNTSFNDRGEPIVCNPRDAINTLKKSQLKQIAIGNYLVTK
jgi:carbamoyltransferase